MRIHIKSRQCFAFISCRYEADVQDIRQRCFANADLLRIHPLYLLSFVYEHRFQRWTDWYSKLWREIVEIETVTNMTSPSWGLKQIDKDRLDLLSHPDNLLAQQHATQVQLCHSQTVVAFASRFGRFCSEALENMEKCRVESSLQPLSRRDMSDLTSRFNWTLQQCEAIAERLSELRNRLTGQISVVYLRASYLDL